MSVSLEFTVKDGKSSVKAIVQGESTEQVITEYQAVLNRFGGAPSPAPVKSKKPETETETDTAATGEKNVVEMKAGSRAAKKMFAQHAVELNEIAIEWAKRFSVVIPEYKNLGAQQVIEHLNFKKPMATMEVEELQEVISLIKSTLTQYSANNAGAGSFLRVMEVIDGLQIGTPEEWTQARTAIKDQDWAFLAMPGNQGMLDFAKAQLATRQNMLQAANITAEAV